MDSIGLLENAVANNASDLHLIVGKKPTLRINGRLHAIEQEEILTLQTNEQLIFTLLTDEQRQLFLANRELDFSYSVKNGRFRINIYNERGNIAAALRLIPKNIKSVEELGLPKILHDFANLRQGFILITGPTGHGKSTTLAALLNEINQQRDCHIVTIEDPIEYIYPEGKSLVSQREMHQDTHSWESALRSVLREDPDIVLVGEMRDYETIAAALTVAETGHLVFASLHTNSASQTIDRIVDIFPATQQNQIRTQLASTLEGILSQRLIPAVSGERIPACELLLASSAVKTSIREAKTHLIDNIILTSGEAGMIPLDASLVQLVRDGKVDQEVARAYALNPEEFTRLLHNKRS